MNLDIRAIGAVFAKLVWVGLRSFVGTVCVVTAAGMVLAALSYFWLRDYSWWWASIAVAVAFVEAVATGCVLGMKLATVTMLAHGLGALRLGRWLVRLVFERMLGVADAELPGERGGRIAQTLERLPLAQAEERLTSAVREWTGDAAEGGWLRRWIRQRLVEAVGKYTLARFREEGAKHGGVDLVRVKVELEDSVDDALVRKVRSGLWLWTTLVIVGFPFVVAAQTWVVIMLLEARH